MSASGFVPSFVHLRLHSEYSIVDGTVRVDDAIEAATTQPAGVYATTQPGAAAGPQSPSGRLNEVVVTADLDRQREQIDHGGSQRRSLRVCIGNCHPQERRAREATDERNSTASASVEVL